MGLFDDLGARFRRLPPAQRALLVVGVPAAAGAAILGNVLESRRSDKKTEQPNFLEQPEVIDFGAVSINDMATFMSEMADIRAQVSEVRQQIETERVPVVADDSQGMTAGKPPPPRKRVTGTRRPRPPAPTEPRPVPSLPDERHRKALAWARAATKQKQLIDVVRAAVERARGATGSTAVIRDEQGNIIGMNGLVAPTPRFQPSPVERLQRVIRDKWGGSIVDQQGGSMSVDQQGNISRPPPPPREVPPPIERLIIGPPGQIQPGLITQVVAPWIGIRPVR